MYGHEHVEELMKEGDLAAVYDLMDEYADWKAVNKEDAPLEQGANSPF